MLDSMHLPRLAVIVGSNRRDSINCKLAQALVRLGAGKFEAVFARIDDLPMYNQDNEGNLPPEVARFKNEIARADGVLIVTPEHDRSIPAVLKNAVDWGARPWGRKHQKFLQDFVARFAHLVTRLAPVAQASAA